LGHINPDTAAAQKLVNGMWQKTSTLTFTMVSAKGSLLTLFRARYQPEYQQDSYYGVSWTRPRLN